MKFNISWDASVSKAPAAFETDIVAAAQYLSSTFSDPVTVNVSVGYGEVGGSTLESGDLGESITYFQPYSYAQVRNALSADAKTGDDATAVAALPSTDPTGGGHYWVPTAEAKALGLLDGSDPGLDGYVGFGSAALFDYADSNGVSAGTYDFYGTALHELSEVMGRQLLVGGTMGAQANSYDPFDLFHYSAPGVHDFVGTKPGYFSVGGGSTNLDPFNTDPSGDFGDWAPGAGNDAALAVSDPGVVNGFTEADLKAMDVLGWDRTAGAAPAAIATADQTGLLVQNSTTHQFDALLFTDGQLTQSAASPDALWPVVASSDIGHDGLPELATQNAATGQIDFVYLNGLGSIGSSLAAGAYWPVHGAGSFDGQSAALLSQDQASGQIDLLSFDDSGNLTASLLLQGGYWKVVGAADFNGDGKADVVTQNAAGQIDILFFNGAQLVGSDLVGGGAAYWPVQDVDNLHGNGHMVAQDPASGQVDELFFTGTALTGSQAETPAFPGWSVVPAGQLVDHMWHI